MEQEIRAEEKKNPNIQHHLDNLENSVEKTRSLFEMLIERLEAVLLPDKDVQVEGPNAEYSLIKSSIALRLNALIQSETAFQTRIEDVTRRLDL